MLDPAVVPSLRSGDDSALDWSPEVPTLRSWYTPSLPHQIWELDLQNDIYQFLTVLEIVPLIRLSRRHKHFIETEFSSSHVILGSSQAWINFYLRCRWFRPWIRRSLPGLRSFCLGHGKFDRAIHADIEKIVRALFIRPPGRLHTLHSWTGEFWDNAVDRPATFPDLQTLVWGPGWHKTLDLTAPRLMTVMMHNRLETLISAQGDLSFLDIMANRTNLPDDGYRIRSDREVPTWNSIVRLLGCPQSRVRTSTSEEKSLVLLCAVLRLPLSSYRWEELGDAMPLIGLEPLEELNYVRPGLRSQNTTLHRDIDELNVYWERLSILWRLLEIVVTEEVKSALCRTSIAASISSGLPGPLLLLENSSLKELCPHLTSLPLLPVCDESKHLSSGYFCDVSINFHKLHSADDDNLEENLVESLNAWIEPVRHIRYYDEFRLANVARSTANLMTRHASTIEHIREMTALPPGLERFPNLKTYFRGDTNGCPSVNTFLTAIYLEHVEMGLHSWVEFYRQWTTGMRHDQQTFPMHENGDAQDEDQSVPLQRYPWPSNSRRVIYGSVSDAPREEIYSAIVTLGIQYMVTAESLPSHSTVFQCYQMVYDLWRIYTHKFQVFSCSVGSWDYPWDCAITEMTTGTITESTWIDLQLANGDDLATIRSRSVHPPVVASPFGDSTLSSGTLGASTLLGITGRHILRRDANGVFGWDELGSLPPARLAHLEKWHRQLRAAVPAKFCSFTSHEYSLGSVPPTSRWLINLIKSRRFGEILQWIRLEWVPLIDFTKVGIFACK